MDDFLANKIIEDLMGGTMTAAEAWKNLMEVQEIISDEKYDFVPKTAHNWFAKLS